MVALFLAAVLVTQPLAFGEKPIASELLAGDAALRAKKSAEWAIGDAKQTVGKWFDGKKQQKLEFAIWLSPATVSRWLGWMRAREGWTDQETQSRWDEARALLGGKLNFVVRVCAFPRLDPVFENEDPAQHAEDLADVRGVVSYGGDTAHAPARAGTSNMNLQSVDAHDADSVLRVLWESQVPLDKIFKGTFDEPETPNSLLNPDIGGYHGSLWFMQCDLPAGLQKQTGFQLRIVTAHKVRDAWFRIADEPKKKPGPKRKRP